MSSQNLQLTNSVRIKQNEVEIEKSYMDGPCSDYFSVVSR